MPEMPSANLQTISTPNKTTSKSGPEFNISPKDIDIEGLVAEIKENLRLTAQANNMKALSCSHMSRKTSRASPYRIPGKYFDCDTGACGSSCVKLMKHKPQPESQKEDPYELLQQLLRDGGLVSEAVRRVKMGLSGKQRFFYDSDEDSKSPLRRVCPQEN